MKKIILNLVLINGIFAFSALMICGQIVSSPLPDILTLEAAGERLVEKNLSVEAARLEVSAAEQSRVYARLRPRPTLNVSAENLRVSGETPFNRLYETGATISQPIELGGQRNSRLEVANRSITLAEARLSGVLRQRLFDMRFVFFEILLAQERVKSDEENSKNFDELLRYSEVRLKEGDIAPGEVLKLRLERTKYISALANSRLNLRQKKIRLLELLGETDFTRIAQLELREPFDFREYNLNLTALKQTALENRPEIKIAEAALSRAESVFKLEHARAKGEIVPYTGFKRVGVDNTVVVGVSIPLPFGNRNQTAISQAEAEQKIAENGLLQSRNRTLAEVESAFLSFETAREQVKVYQGSILEQAEESLKVALLLYREGGSELINVLEAQRTRTDVRSSYYQALLNYYASLF